MLYRFISETRIQACPKNGVVDGRSISNLLRFFEANPEIAEAEGYKQLTPDEEPEYNPNNQYLSAYYENRESILCHWTVNDFVDSEE